MIETFPGSHRATYQLSILAVIFYGLLDALSTLLCFYKFSIDGYDALDSEISPLIRSGIFGSGWKAIIISKICIIAVIFLYLRLISQYRRLVPVVNSCLITMIIFGAVATLNNANIALGGADIMFFSVSPLMASSMLSLVILLFGFYEFLAKTTTCKTTG